MPCNLSSRGDLGSLGVRVDPQVSGEEGGGEAGGRNQGIASTETVRRTVDGGDEPMPDVGEVDMERDEVMGGAEGEGEAAKGEPSDWSNAASLLGWS